MPRFDMLLLQPEESIKDIIARIPLTDIALALKHAQSDIVDYFFENMTPQQQALFEALQGEMTDATLDDSKQAQAYIIERINE